MKRFLILFAIMLVVSVGLMWAMMAQNGYDLFDPRMSGMMLVAVLVAMYVSFRISRILAKRAERAESGSPLKGAQKSKLSGMFNSKSAALIAEGKLEEEAPAAPEVAPTPAGEKPTRVPQSASVADKMAARRERYRRAKEEGKI